jgi:probable HAF family extracellular repeat protein
MNLRVSNQRLLWVALFIGLATCLFPGPALGEPDRAAQLRFSIVDLGVFPGGTFTIANGINNAGQITGSGDVPGGHQHAFLYSGVGLLDLGVLNATDSYGTRLNDSAQMIGFLRFTPAIVSSFFYSNSPMYDFERLTGLSAAGPTDINNAGDIVGWANQPGRGNLQTGFLYRNGSVQFLPVLHPDGISWASGMNEAGQIVGGAAIGPIVNPGSYYIWHATLYSGGQAIDLGVLPGGTYSGANAINGAGHIVGFSEVAGGDSHAFLYRDGMMADLGVLAGDRYASAVAINDSGTIVGYSHDGATRFHVFIYVDGAMHDLSNLLRGNQGWQLLSAAGINEAGQIVGSGLRHGKQHGFMLTPVSKAAR